MLVSVDRSPEAKKNIDNADIFFKLLTRPIWSKKAVEEYE